MKRSDSYCCEISRKFAGGTLLEAILEQPFGDVPPLRKPPQAQMAAQISRMSECTAMACGVLRFLRLVPYTRRRSCNGWGSGPRRSGPQLPLVTVSPTPDQRSAQTSALAAGGCSNSREQHEHASESSTAHHRLCKIQQNVGSDGRNTR